MSESAPGGEASSSTDADDKTFSCECCGKVYTRYGSLKAHYKSDNNPCTGLECPSCDADYFVNERGLNTHHSRSHGESNRLVEFECDVCGESGTKEPHHYNENGPNYCSHECQGNDLREEKTIICENCGEEATFSPPSEAGRFCNKDCLHEYFRGETHPSYKGRHDYYGDRWEQQRRKARERDDYSCQICGRSKEELGKIPAVHHAHPVRTFEDPNDAHDLINLITLCPKHHAEWEGIPLRPITE